MKPNDSYLNNFCTEQSWKPSHNNQIVSWQMYRGQRGPCPSSCRVEAGWGEGKARSSRELDLGGRSVTMQPLNRAELPDLANKKTGCPVEFEFQINNE